MTAQAPVQYSPLIRDLPNGDRPRERLRDYGPIHLSDTELIAIILRTGVKGENVLTLSQRLLSHFGGIEGLAKASFEELCELNGISEAKACQVIAAIDLGRRSAIPKDDGRIVIRSARDVYSLVAGELKPLAQERLRALMLNTKNEVMAMTDVYQGTVNSATVRIAEVIRPAVRGNYPAMIVVHNHPSGDPTPSPEDVLVTRRIRQSAELMDIELLDHVIIGGRGPVSMKSSGLGF